MRAQAFTLVLALGLGTMALAFTQIPQVCPFGFARAQRVTVAEYSSVHVWTRGGGYEAGGSALLDYMRHFGPGPMFDLRRESHSLNVVLSVSAEMRAAAERATFSVRLHHGSDVWSRRPTNYDVQSPNGTRRVIRGASRWRSIDRNGPLTT